MDTQFIDDFRWAQWCATIPDYNVMTRSQKKKAKARYKMISLGSCDKAVPCAKSNKKETAMNGMYITAPAPITEADTNLQQRAYLRDRASDIMSIKLNAAEREFGLTDDPRPMTVKDLLARIKDGKFVPPEERNDYETYSVLDNMRWRDPNKVADKDGFKVAQDKLVTAYQTLRDGIAIKSPAEALKELQDFEKANA